MLGDDLPTHTGHTGAYTSKSREQAQERQRQTSTEKKVAPEKSMHTYSCMEADRHTKTSTPVIST